MSLQTCNRLMKDMADLKVSLSVDITSHKEELASWIKYDENDRQVIKEKLKLYIDPLNTAGQASALVNIVSGRICPDAVNVHHAVDLGKAQMEEKLAGQRDSTNHSKESSHNERVQEENKDRYCRTILLTTDICLGPLDS